MSQLRREIATYYIEAELDNLLTNECSFEMSGLSDDGILRLLEAISFTYRANDVFDMLVNEGVAWRKEEYVPIDTIKLTGMGTELTKIIYSDEIARNPLKLIEYLTAHDEIGKYNFRMPVASKRRLILIEKDGELRMVDGSHRLLAMAASGVREVSAYIATTQGGNNQQPYVGDTMLLRLRKLWQYTDDIDFRRNIERIVKDMIKYTANGRTSVELYWVSDAPNEQVRRVGEVLLAEVSAHRP